MAIVITGNPGVGKHTLTKKLAEILGYPILDINKIAIESGFYEKKKDTIDVDVKKLKKYLEKKIKNKTILVGHLAPYVVSKEKIKKVIILRKSPYKLIPIYKKRKYSKKKIDENLQSEILGIIAYDSLKKFGKKKCFQIDTTSRTVSKIAKMVFSITNDEFESENIDWLSLINQKNDLKKFFSY